LAFQDRIATYTPEVGRPGDAATLVTPYDRFLPGDVEAVKEGFNDIWAAEYSSFDISLGVRTGGAYPMCITNGVPKPGDNPSLRPIERIQNGTVFTNAKLLSTCELGFRIGDIYVGIPGIYESHYLEITPGEYTNDTTSGEDEAGLKTVDHKQAVTIVFRPPFGVQTVGQEVGNANSVTLWEMSGTLQDAWDGAQSLSNKPFMDSLAQKNWIKQGANIGAEIDLLMPIDLSTGEASTEHLDKLYKELMTSFETGQPGHSSARYQLCLLAQAKGFDAFDAVTDQPKDSCTVFVQPKWPDPEEENAWKKLKSIGIMPNPNSPDYKTELASYQEKLEDAVPLDMLNEFQWNNTWLYAKGEIVPELGAYLISIPDYAWKKMLAQ
jgi:hypothetical protein